MARNFTVSTQINKPVADVFKAVVSSEEMSNYFTDNCSQDYKEGETTVYMWDGFGDHPVYVKTVKENELIIFTLNSREWQKTNDVPDYGKMLKALAAAMTTAVAGSIWLCA